MEMAYFEFKKVGDIRPQDIREAFVLRTFASGIRAQHIRPQDISLSSEKPNPDTHAHCQHLGTLSSRHHRMRVLE